MSGVAPSRHHQSRHTAETQCILLISGDTMHEAPFPQRGRPSAEAGAMLSNRWFSTLAILPGSFASARGHAGAQPPRQPLASWGVYGASRLARRASCARAALACRPISPYAPKNHPVQLVTLLLASGSTIVAPSGL